MAQPYVGEIRLVGFNFAPAGWAFCDGSLLSIAENETLFQLIGTTYGGDGQSTFALPDLRGRVPIHQGNGFVLADKAGQETVALTLQQLPAHTHAWQATTAGATTPVTVGNALATPASNVYQNGVPAAALAGNTVAKTGGSRPHNNVMPYQAINYIISLFGIFPSPT